MTIVEDTFKAIDLVIGIFSFPGNIFIIAVNILDFCKNRRFPLSDQLILGYCVFSHLHILLDLFQSASNELAKTPALVYMYLNMCSLWFSALLSIHYCLKIVHINHWFYICLQKRFPKLFPWTIIAFLIGNFFLSLYSALEKNLECPQNTTSTVLFMKESPRRSWSSLTFMTICGLCTFLCSVSALTILISLLKHMKRIRENTEGSRSPNVDAHIRAVKTVTSLLVTNVLIFSSVFIFTLTEISFTFTYLFSSLTPLCHIFNYYFLIKGTKKLYMALEEILNWCSCFTKRNH